MLLIIRGDECIHSKPKRSFLIGLYRATPGTGANAGVLFSGINARDRAQIPLNQKGPLHGCSLLALILLEK